MKKLILILLIPIAGLLSPLSGRTLTDALPPGTVFLLEVPNINTSRAHYEASPLKGSLSQFDWKQIILSVYTQALDEGGMDESMQMEPEELQAVLEKNTAMLEGIAEHLNGSVVIAVGDLEGAIRTFKTTGEAREALYQDMAINAEAPGDLQKIAEQEEALEQQELFAVLNEIHLMAEVKDGPGLLAKIQAFVEESLRQQKGGTLLSLETLDWEGLPVFKFNVQEEAEEGEVAPVIPLAWWTVQDGVWVIRATELGLRNTLDQLKMAPANTLSTEPGYVESMQYLGEQDTVVWINFPRTDALIRMSMGEEALNEPMESGKTPAMILNWLGLDAILPYALGVTTHPEGMQGKGRMGFSRETPLSRILIEPTDELAPTPSFLHKDSGQVSSLRWGIGTGLRRIETEMTTFLPEMVGTMATIKMAGVMQLGMDVQTQFLDHLGTGMVMVQQLDSEVMDEMMRLSEEQDVAKLMQFRMQHPTSGQNYLLGLEMKNKEGVTSGLNTLLSRVHPTGLPEPRMFQGHPIHFPIPAMGGEQNELISYTLLDGYLLLAIGSPNLLQDAIRASLEPSSQLARAPEFQELRDRAPASSAFEYTPKSVQETAWKVIASSLNASGLKLSGLPDLEAFGSIFGSSYSTAARKGTVFEMRMESTFAPPAE